MHCSGCQHEVQPGSRYCSECGRLADAPVEGTAEGRGGEAVLALATLAVREPPRSRAADMGWDRGTLLAVGCSVAVSVVISALGFSWIRAQQVSGRSLVSAPSLSRSSVYGAGPVVAERAGGLSAGQRAVQAISGTAPVKTTLPSRSVNPFGATPTPGLLNPLRPLAGQFYPYPEPRGMAPAGVRRVAALPPLEPTPATPAGLGQEGGAETGSTAKPLGGGPTAAPVPGTPAARPFAPPAGASYIDIQAREEAAVEPIAPKPEPGRLEVEIQPGPAISPLEEARERHREALVHRRKGRLAEAHAKFSEAVVWYSRAVTLGGSEAAAAREGMAACLRALGQRP